MDFRIIVIGGSAGSVSALQTLVAALPADLPAAVFVVVHMREYQVSVLPDILARKGPLPAAEAIDGEAIEPGRIYVCQPGHHLLIDGDKVGVKAGPKENRFRPSIDALFRSAAYMHRERVIGVIISGMLSDGVSGLWTVKRFGGVAIVQDPLDASFDGMPANALAEVDVDHTIPVREIGVALAKLCKMPLERTGPPSEEIVERARREVEVAASDNSFKRGMMHFGELTPFTCPECHGTLVKIREESLVRYRCHTGHGFTSNALLSGITDSVEALLWSALRAQEEGVMLLEHMAQHFEARGKAEDARAFKAKAEDMRKRAQAIQKYPISSEHVSGDNLEAPAPGRKQEPPSS